MFYRCKYFSPYELVPETIIKTLDEKSLDHEYAYKLFDKGLLRLADFIRKEYGKMYVNTWKENGSRYQSGLRTPDMEYYSPTSQHTFGRALDCIFDSGHDPEIIRHDFRRGMYNHFLRCEGIQVTFEENINWLHFDTRNNYNLVNFF